MLNKISPHIWLEKDVVQAAAFYTGLFPNSRLLDSVVLENTPSGDAQSVRFILHDQLFQAIAAGPVFKLNASISFMAVCKTVQEVEAAARGAHTGRQRADGAGGIFVQPPLCMAAG